MLRAATGIVTTYTVDVAVVWVQLTMRNALYSTKVHTVTAYFYHCHRVTSNHRQFGWSQIMGLHGLSTKYDDMSLTLQCWQVFFRKLWEIDRHHQTQLYKWQLWTCHYTTLNGTELLHNVQHCSQALMYTIHTCHTPDLAVWFWCVHFPPLSVCCLRFSASLRHGQTSVGEGEEWVKGGRSILALVRQNIVQALST